MAACSFTNGSTASCCQIDCDPLSPRIGFVCGGVERQKRLIASLQFRQVFCGCEAELLLGCVACSVFAEA